MARKYVKETEAVRNLNSELKEQQKLINSLDNTYADLAVAVMSVAEGHEKSTKYSKENVDLATQQSKAGSAILNNLNKQTLSSKIRLGVTRLMSDKEDEITQELFNQYDIAQKINKEKSKEEEKTNKLKMNFKDIKDSLEGTLPFGSQLFKSIDKTASRGKRIGAVLGIFGALAAGAMKKFADLTKVIGENFGAIGMTTPEIKDGLLGASVEATRLGFGMSDVASVVNELTTNFGFSLEESIKLSSSVLDTSKALGLSNTEGTALIGTLSQVTGLSLEASTQFAKQTALLAKQSGVAPNVVLKDIAASSESIAKFTDASGENIGKAAIMATKLGTNLGTVAGVAEGLLDFQSSISKEIEASVMLGKDLNFQKARELALNNDIEGAMAEIVGQLGTEEEFNKLNALERQALADSISVSTSELAKFVANQDKALTLTESIAAQPGFEELVGRDAIDNITKITNDLKTIGATLITSVGPILSSIVGGMASFTKYISESKLGFTIMAGLAGGLATALMVSAVAGIWSSLSLIPFGVGLLAAGALTASMMSSVSKAKSVGDLGMDPNGGPIVSSPTMGGMSFQGKPGDGVSMGEQFGVNGQQEGSNISFSTHQLERDNQKTIEELTTTRKGTETRLDKLIKLLEANPNKIGRATGDALVSGIK